MAALLILTKAPQTDGYHPGGGGEQPDDLSGLRGLHRRPVAAGEDTEGKISGTIRGNQLRRRCKKGHPHIEVGEPMVVGLSDTPREMPGNPNRESRRPWRMTILVN